jgi:hypothetical protein
MSNGLKFDNGKPDFTYVSLELLVGLAKVREFGAKKYTRYGECNCAVSVESRKFIQGKNADLVMTNGLNQSTQSINNPKSKTIKTGPSPIENNSTSTTKGVLEMPPQSAMELLDKKWIKSSMRVAKSAENPSEYVFTTATRQDRFEEPSAQLVMSASDGLKTPIGPTEHEPTCNALKIVAPGRDNWKKGFPLTKSLAAASRHIEQFINRQDFDKESGLLHLYHAVASLEHAIYDYIHRPENDDRGTDGVYVDIDDILIRIKK